MEYIIPDLTYIYYFDDTRADNWRSSNTVGTVIGFTAIDARAGPLATTAIGTMFAVSTI